MQQEVVMVQGVKCDGCVSTIRDGLLTLSGVQSVEVDIPTGRVTIQGMELSRERLVVQLEELGYPQAEST